MRVYDGLCRGPFPGARNRGGARDNSTTPVEPAPTRHLVVAGDDDDGGDEIERTYLDDLNPDSKRILTAFVEPALAAAECEERFQFERHGYFVADWRDHSSQRPVFNRAVTLRDSWSKP